ncbi:tetratricopeptide repeat protein [Spirillospora sp. NPDC048824]|uniref:tetratricopeptide repeat protein n=1 Tax=Spirillospora sp. NPDC048824 TaxID=3364526 RepID=UPI00371D7672
MSIAEKYAATADEHGDRAAARVYRRSAAAFPVDGPPDSPGAQYAELARHAAATGDHETAMRLLAQAAEAGEHAKVLAIVQEASLLCTADADVPNAHAYYALGLELAGEPDRIRLHDLPAARPELTALYAALTGGDGAAIVVLAELRNTGHFEAACQTVIAVAMARAEADPDSARGLLRPVAEMAPPEQAVRAWNELGSLADDADEAVHAYERAAAIEHPAAHTALRHLIRTLYEQDRPADTALFADRATATGDPLTVAHGHRLLGLLREKQDDLDGAMREFRLGIAAAQVINESEFPGELRLDLARLLQRQGNTETAMAEVEHVLAAAGTERLRAKAVTYRGNIAVLSGDLATACEAFAQVALMNGDDDVAEWADGAANNLLGIANSAYGDGRHDLAVQALTLAARTGKRDLAIGVVEARTTELAEAGDTAAALRYLDAGLGFPLEPKEEIRLADLCGTVGEPDRAREIFERLAGHPDETVQLIAGSRLVDPSDGDATPDPAARWLRADDLVDAGEYAEAREILTPLIEGDSHVVQHARLSLGRTYHEEDPARARELYLAAIETPGGRSDQVVEMAKMYLGSLAKQARDWPEALRWYQAVIDSGSAGNGPMAAAHLGELAYWQGDRDSAVRFYELCLAMGTDNAELIGESAYRAGEIRHAQGDLPAAAAHLSRALDAGHEGFADQARILLTRLND